MCQALAKPCWSGSHPDRRETDKETGSSEHKEGTPESCGSGQASSSRGHLYRGIKPSDGRTGGADRGDEVSRS